MNNRAVDFWVGLFVVLGFAALVFLALKAGNLTSFSTNEKYRVEAQFDNIGGLKARAPVKSAGVVVGRVAGITLDPVSFRAVVAMDFERGFEFPKDSSARILTSGLLGEQYVGVEPGGDVENIQDGGKFERTQSAVVLENLISQFLFSKATDSAPAPK